VKWLDHDKTGTWITYFVVIIVILLVLAAVGYMMGRWYVEPSAAQTQQDLYGATPLDGILLRMDKRALEEAYHAQMLKLFGVWIASGAPNEAVQFRNGLATARRAYTLAAQSIAKREQELERLK
jgi:CDP-diglyceride synthetase